MSDYLSHHGVKGMKCGVRKDKDKAQKNLKAFRQPREG